MESTETAIKGTACSCPHCGSENTGKYSTIHESGVSHSSGKSQHFGIAMAGGKMVPMAGESTTTGVQQTELSKKTAPPTERVVFGKTAVVVCSVLSPAFAAVPWLVITFLIGLFFGVDSIDLVSWIVYVASLAVVFFAIWRAYQDGKEDAVWNETEYPTLRDEWSHKWLCLRCGESFSVAK